MADNTNKNSNSKRARGTGGKVGAPFGNKNALKYSDDKYVPLVDRYYEEMLADKRYPSDDYLAVYLDIDDCTIREWLKTHVCFRDAVARGRHKAEQALFDRSLNGEWNDRFAALLLKNRHGFVDKVEQKVEADVGVKIVFSEES